MGRFPLLHRKTSAVSSIKSRDSRASRATPSPVPTTLSTGTKRPLDEEPEIIHPEISMHLPSEMNGTLWTTFRYYVTSPRKAAKRIKTVVHTFNKQMMHEKITELCTDMSDNLNLRLNHACDGYDAVQAYDKVQASIPKLTVPTMKQFGRSVDFASDKFQDFMPTLRNLPVPQARERGSSREFVWIMEQKARGALFRQRICAQIDTIVTRENLEWQNSMMDSLANLYESAIDRHTFDELTTLKAVWVPFPDINSWELYLEGDEDLPVMLGTKFQISGRRGWVDARDYARGSKPARDDGDWEEVDMF